MKKTIFLLLSLFLFFGAYAQAPQKMSYQAVIHDATNCLVVDAAVGMQISILQGTATGSAVYVETHTPTTNINGLVSLEIGMGDPVTNTFSGIDWSAGPYFLKTETNPSGTTAPYTITGVSQLLSVPYALYGEDADADPANELQALSQTGIDVTLSNGGGTISVADNDNDPANELQDWSNLPGIPAGFVDDIDNVDDADADPMNEIELPTNPNTGDIAFYNGTNWASIIPGQHGQTLSLCEGVPTWGPCPTCIDGIQNGDETGIDCGGSTCASCSSLAIGDLHAGGIIFYLDGNGGGLVAALSDQSTGAQWGCIGTDIPGLPNVTSFPPTGSGSEVGDGASNTASIVAVCATGGIAARLCDDLVLNGFEDWFLPSIGELELMYTNLHLNALGGFANGNYWSSTEAGTFIAWRQSFTSGGQNSLSKGSSIGHVRAVRAF